MVPRWLLALSFPALAAAGLSKTYGVSPNLLKAYVPLKAGTWKCLDGSKEIPWDFVNDDSCDCPDGSDEPGTGACANTTFYCHNAGHIGSSIPSSRVRDGLCEPDCCDGSDERPGVCPDVCQEVGAVYKKQQEAERKLRKTGSKIRSTYVQFAHKEKKRLEGRIQELQQEISTKEKEVARLKDIAERSESLSAAALEHKKQSSLFTVLMKHSAALKSLQREYYKHLDREKALGDILDNLRAGYNPNYQDMAVLEAVRGWEELAGLSPINDRDKDASAQDDEAVTESEEEKKDSTPTDELEEGAWTAEQLDNDLDALLRTDYVSLLLEHEDHIRLPAEGSLLFRLTSYIPDSLLPQYEDFKEGILGWLEKLGIVGTGDGGAGAETSRARQAFHDAENDLNNSKRDLKNAESDVASIFEVTKFGKEGEWKKLENLCLEKDEGEYTYEVCLFGEAKQKPNKAGSTFKLGSFSSWNPSPDVEVGSPEYYQKSIYDRGTKCWNGPERSVILVLSCGTENALQTVTELEKCEYQITGTTPALCLPPDGDKKSSSKDEL